MSLSVVRGQFSQYLGNVYYSSGSASDVALNAAFVNGTSGPCVGLRFLATQAEPITEFYVFLGAFNGTLGNITMACTINNEGSVAGRPGTTVWATSTATTMPGAAVKWIKFTFGSPYTPAVGEVLWALVSNTSSSPTVDYPSLRVSSAMTPTDLTTNLGSRVFSTSNGFTTDGTSQVKAPFVLVQNGAVTIAQPFTARANCFASNLLERGIRITPLVDTKIYSVVSESPAVSLVKVRILADGTAPGGTSLYEYDWVTTNSTADLIGVFILPSTITLSAGVTYRVTFTYSGSNTPVPGSQARIEDYSSYSTMFDSILDTDRSHYSKMIVDNGAGGWTEFKDYTGGIVLGVDDFPRMRSPAVGDFQGGLR